MNNQTNNTEPAATDPKLEGRASVQKKRYDSRTVNKYVTSLFQDSK
jgi:hypothetical protein